MKFMVLWRRSSAGEPTTKRGEIKRHKKVKKKEERERKGKRRERVLEFIHGLTVCIGHIYNNYHCLASIIILFFL